MKRLFRTLLILLLVLAVPVGGFTACSKSSQQATRYHCPMHPTYVSDKPGDCPICGMRLVPIDEKKGGSASTSVSTAAGHDHEHPSEVGNQAMHTTWTCPMHPEVVSDKPGRCPKCNMPLEPKPATHANAAAPPNAADPNAALPNAAAPPNAADPNAVPRGERKILYYRSPMDPKVTSPTPTKDSMGMDFVPVYSDAVAAQPGGVPGLAPIEIDSEGLRLAGVRTAAAETGKIARTIRAVGVVRPDETRVRHVHTKIAGWIEKLFVNFTGEPVVAGRPILTIYSQELLAAQHEYLQARKAATTMQGSDFGAVREGADDMLSAAKRRLELLDIPKSLIAALDRGGEPSRTVTITSPVSGVVMSKNAFEGQQIEPGTELFTVTDLSRVWIEADIYESEAPFVHVGQEGKISFPNDPGPPMSGKIKYIYPYLNTETRTLRVRFSFPNPGMKLKLDSYANVELPVETDEGAIIQDSAILDTGLRQVVFVNTKDGRFEPRLVKVGIRSEGKAQILSGVSPGERVAVKANFLLDSESRLRAAIAPEPAPAVVPSADPGVAPSTIAVPSSPKPGASPPAHPG